MGLRLRRGRSQQRLYYRIFDNDDPKVSDIDYCMYGESNSGVLFRGGRMLAQYVKPYFNHHWDGFHGYFYTPPEKPTEYAAAAVNAAGNVCHIAFAIFRSYYERVPYAQSAGAEMLDGCCRPLIKLRAFLPRPRNRDRMRCVTQLHTKVPIRDPGQNGHHRGTCRAGSGATVIPWHYASVARCPKTSPLVTYARAIYGDPLPGSSGYRMICWKSRYGDWGI
jgi:hypothetical protein